MKKRGKTAKPFLKWAGGKTQLLDDISKNIPFGKCDTFSYVEPFLGSGAVLFWILQNYPNIRRVVVNDINEDLINCYYQIKRDVSELIEILTEYEKEYHLTKHGSEERKKIFYSKRNLFNERRLENSYQAALFIFLNKTCFNGLYRVNRKNEFNVPQGSYKKPKICDEDNLLLVSEYLQRVEILNEDFRETKKYAAENSLFYLDPPYKPLSDTSSFTSYTKKQFDDTEQIRLKKFCDELDEAGSKWILSNSDVRGKNPDDDFFDVLYNKYQIDRVLAKRSISANSKKRGQLTELLITN